MTYNITKPHKQIRNQLENQFRDKLWYKTTEELNNKLKYLLIEKTENEFWYQPKLIMWMYLATNKEF